MDIKEQLSMELKKSIKIQNEMQISIDNLIKENTFLTETITLNKLGQITTERRQLQSQIYNIKKEAELKVSEAQKVYDKYQKMVSDISALQHELLNKKKQIDGYISLEASKQISEQMQQLKSEKKRCQDELDKHIRENDKKLELQTLSYEHKCKNWALALVISFVITAISIYINFIWGNGNESKEYERN